MNQPASDIPDLADNVVDLPESGIRTMFNLAEQQGGDLVRLELGEPDFDTPEHIINAASEAAEGGATHYTHSAGMPELRGAIAEEMRSGEVELDPATQVLVTTGAIEAIYFALLTTVNTGEEVIVPTPAWSSYYTQAEALGIELVEVPMPADEGFSLSAGRIGEAITDRTSAIIINSPCNPTGRVYDPSAIRGVVDIASEHGVYVIADEVYENLAYEGKQRSIRAIADNADHVLSAHSFSKTYAMTGWRVGWLTGPEPVIDAGAKLHQGTTSCASSVSQHVALAALRGTQNPTEGMREAFHERRDYVVDRIATLPSLSCPAPQGMFYVFLNVDALEGSSFEIATRLLREYGVVTAPGTGFGDAGSGYLRLSFANGMDRLEVAFDRIEQMARTELER